MMGRAVAALLALSLGGWVAMQGGDTNQLGGLGHATTMTTATCHSDVTNLTTYSHTPISTGASDADSVIIVVGFIGEDALSVFGVNSATATVDGKVLTMTQIVDEDGTGIVNTAFFTTTVPTMKASSITIGAVYSEPVTSNVACVWTFRGRASVTAVSSGTDDDATTGALVLTTGTTTAGGFVVCVSGASGVAEAATWAVATEVEDTQNAEMDYSNAQVAATGASMANTATWAGASLASSGSCVAVR